MDIENMQRSMRNSFLEDVNNMDDGFQPVRKKPRLNLSAKEAPLDSNRHFFDLADLQNSLFASRVAKSAQHVNPRVFESDKERGQDCFWCDASFAELNFNCPLHKQRNSAPKQAAQLPLAVRSLPPEVGICISKIPGEGYGVCAKRLIPVGAWIGPYEGQFVKPEELSYVTDTSYMWEVYNDDKLAGFIDGSDETVSSWMRYIRCARHKQEQNLYAFQYLSKVYYRSFKPILPGQELLVWYDEKYPQYFGVPTAIFDLGQNVGVRLQQNNDALTMTEVKDRKTCEDLTLNHAPPTPPSSIPSPSSPGALSASAQPINPQHYSPSDPVNNSIQPEVTSAFDFPSVLSRTEKPHELVVAASTVKENMKLDQSPTRLISTDITPNHSDNEDASPVEPKQAGLPLIPDLSLWKCGQCKKSFPQRTMLQMHICGQAPKKPYQCGHCSESFSRPTELRAHAVVHASKKPFKCGYCSRAFAGSTTLNNHIRTHTGEKPFVCEACGKNFTQGSQLSRHQRLPGDCVARA